MGLGQSEKEYEDVFWVHMLAEHAYWQSRKHGRGNFSEIKKRLKPAGRSRKGKPRYPSDTGHDLDPRSRGMGRA